MTLNQLLYFAEVYKQKSISLAAINLNIAQQSLSSSIQQLENELSLTLFTRTAKGTFPTKDGIRLYKSVLIIFDELTKFQKLSLLPLKENIKIACPNSLSELVNNLYFSLSQTFENVFFEFIPFHYNEVEKFNQLILPDIMLMHIIDYEPKKFDLYIPPEYTAKRISQNPISVHIWTSTNSPLNTNEEITLDDLLSSELVLLYHLFNQNTFSHYFSQHKELNLLITHTKEILFDYMEHYQYVTIDICYNKRPLIFPQLSENKNFKLIPLSDDFPQFYLWLIYKKNCERYYLRISDLLLKIFTT